MNGGTMAASGVHRGHVLITGASTGIGRASALHLASLGFHVFAGVRRDIDAREIEKLGSECCAAGGGVCALNIDVTDRCSIATAASILKSSVGDAGLAGLVNNAGISLGGPVEHVSLDEWRRQFEINFFGPIAVTQAMLPLLRAHVAKFGLWSARLVNMSSIAGKVAQPIAGPYTASKFALESLSDSLRLELRAQGIHVCVVSPGAIDTPMWKKAKDADAAVPRDHPSRKLYGELIDNVMATLRKTSAHSIPPLTVAKAVASCLTQRKPKARYNVGLEAKAGAISKKLLPDTWFEAALAKFLHVPHAPRENGFHHEDDDETPEISVLRN
jgi:NAD(P)-dependent dehydrogenase (short-subunit alcohol dehydrogenase family)